MANSSTPGGGWLAVLLSVGLGVPATGNFALDGATQGALTRPPIGPQPLCAEASQRATLAQSDGEAWQALGICEEERHRLKQAAEAYRRSLGVSTAESARPLRLAGYAALARLGQTLRPPRGTARTQWRSSAPACAAALWVAAFRHDLGGTGLRAEERGLRLCTNARWLGRPAPAEAAQGCFEITLATFEDSKCRPGDVGGAEGGAATCARGQPGQSCREAVARCRSSAQLHRQRSRSCQFVWVDGCLGRVGAVCDGRAKEFDRVGTQDEFEE